MFAIAQRAACSREPSRMTSATAAGSSHVGTCPQPGSRTCRARGIRSRARLPWRGSSSRSRVPQAIVTGTSRSPRDQSKATTCGNVASKPGESARLCVARIASSAGTRQGRPKRWPCSAARPARVRSGASIRRPARRAIRREVCRTKIPYGRSQPSANPIGDRSVALRARPVPASPSAIPPPSSCPRRAGARGRAARRAPPRRRPARRPRARARGPAMRRSPAGRSRRRRARRRAGRAPAATSATGCRCRG